MIEIQTEIKKGRKLGKYRLLRRSDSSDHTYLVLESPNYFDSDKYNPVDRILGEYQCSFGNKYAEREIGIYEISFHKVGDCIIKLDRTMNRTKLKIINTESDKREKTIKFLEMMLR